MEATPAWRPDDRNYLLQNAFTQTNTHTPSSSRSTDDMAAVSLKERVSQSIYHELQEPDSSLCAQHCLNSLLQDQIFTAADLAELGRQLDEREEAARAEGGRSAPGMGSSSMSSASNTGGSGSGSSSGSRRRQPSPPDFGRAQHLNADRSRNVSRARRIVLDCLKLGKMTWSLVQTIPHEEEVLTLSSSVCCAERPSLTDVTLRSSSWIARWMTAVSSALKSWTKR